MPAIPGTACRRASEAVAWLLLAALLITALPLFLRLPPWVDITYHDVSARNALQGGVHYRDVFETNLPGMVWHHMLVRSLFGWSMEALRIADLVVIGSATMLLTYWLRVSRIQRIWFVFAIAFFYLGGTEFIHCQRDGWMLLPTVIALHLRGRQVERTPTRPRGQLYAMSVLEGLVWGWAVWIKPHAIVPALFVWLASTRRMSKSTARRAAMFDLLGLLTGGLIAGVAGSVWLIATGAWPHMWDVLLHWNPEYYDWSLMAFYHKLCQLFMHFPAWSLIHVAAIPVACCVLYRSRFWTRGTEGRSMHEGLLAALYLGWLVEATFLQKPFPYAHAPVVILATAVLASMRWPVGQFFFAWCAAGSLIHVVAQKNEPVRRLMVAAAEARPHTFRLLVPLHPFLNPYRLEFWPRCLRENGNPELWNDLTFYYGIHCAPEWVELRQMSEKLRELGVRDRELICWYDSTHPLYLELGIRPAWRFMHVMTALDFKNRREDIRREVIASGHRYVVSDLALVRMWYEFEYPMDPARPRQLPADFPSPVRDVYPWNQPIVFTTGRYSLHEVTQPIEKVMFALPHE